MAKAKHHKHKTRKTHKKTHKTHEKPQKHIHWHALFILVLFIIIGTAGVAYFTLISPAFVQKPVIQEPIFEDEEDEEIQEEHIQYLVNEIGAYKLHDDPTSGEQAVMEFKIKDSTETYAITVTDNYPEVRKGEAANPDLRIETSEANLIILLSADDFSTEIVYMVNTGEATIEILTDEKTLALKGYKAIYDSLTGQADVPTAQVIRDFDSRFIR